MSNVVREDINPTQALLTVQLTRAEYEPIFLKKLKEYRQKAQMRGFRQGKVPMGMIRKMYGQGLLAEIVTEELNSRLFNYLNEEQVDYLAEPMIREETMLMAFDIDNLQDYQVQFDLGLRPQFELQGWDASTAVKYPEITPSEDELDRIIHSVRKENGQREDLTEGQVAEQDLVEFHLEEWEDGAKKEGGVHSHAVIGIEDELEPEFREQVLGKSIGDTFMVDPYRIEKDRSEQWVRQHILHLQEDAPETGRQFMARVDKITRVTLAEMDEAFFQEVTGDDSIKDEEAYKAFWRARFPGYFQRDVQGFLGTQMRHILLNANPLALPEEILRRWAVQRAADEKEPRQWTDQDLDDFVRNIRYSIIIDAIGRSQDIQVTEEDLIRAQLQELYNYFGSSADPNMLAQLAQSLLQKEETRSKIARDLYHQRIVDAFYQVVTVQKEQIPSSGLYDWVTAEMEKFETKAEPAQVS